MNEKKKHLTKKKKKIGFYKVTLLMQLFVENQHDEIIFVMA